MTELVLVILIFVTLGFTLLAANLILGRLLRPDRPSPAKGEVYECGERPIGTAWVQFDLRFYVVALLFVIFDVELAFFFPWAVVFGSANRAGSEALPAATRAEAAAVLHPRAAAETLLEPPPPAAARHFAWLAFADILVFFGVLLVGFAYLWRRGDLEWVRSTSAQTGRPPPATDEPARAPPAAETTV